ncbi:uroporphyrinogen III decarboxylase [Halothermothrix orenii]|uniref:Uroporphyrinogen-III decarboxylase n=1 Tax=Halothermothrix orenii (strain H 168 / OCM 544 / DSM 9562) TaxID=373903 RepID=B8CXM6_HALOH|nr:uroporphyrinogen III decarboxylase [Halothermothrix orenii]ACL70045.1 Uroporphyrinogen-III decarboxylase [Halothermothrix orenii H 168]
MGMTSRERIMAVLRGKEPDRIPWSPLVGRYYVNSLEEQGIKLEDIAPREMAKTPALKRDVNLYEVEVVRHIGADIMYRHVNSYKLHYKNCKLINETRNGVRYEGFETPVGKIYSEHKKSGGTEFISKHLLENKKDIEVLTYVFRNAVVEPDYQDFYEFDEHIGDDGIATLTGPLTPIQLMLQFYVGVANTTYFLMDYKDEMENLFSEIHNLNRDIYRVMAESPAEVIITYEDTSTTVLSPAWYEQYCKKELDEYADIIHDYNKIFITHMCGKLSLLTDTLAEGKMDGIDSVCPPTTGDLEPGDALEETGKIIIGGLEPAALVRMNVEETREYTLEKLKQVGTGRNFILSTGDSTAYGTPLENLKAITRVIKEYGQFPLNL